MYYGRYANCKRAVLELTGTRENLRYSITCIGLQLTSQQSCNNSLRKNATILTPNMAALPCGCKPRIRSLVMWVEQGEKAVFAG